MDAEVKKRLDRMDEKLNNIYKILVGDAQNKSCWVKASVITDLTGWNAEKMRQARNNGYIKFKEEEGFWYDLNSLSDIFITNPSQLKKAS